MDGFFLSVCFFFDVPAFCTMIGAHLGYTCRYICLVLFVEVRYHGFDFMAPKHRAIETKKPLYRRQPAPSTPRHGCRKFGKNFEVLADLFPFEVKYYANNRFIARNK